MSRTIEELDGRIMPRKRAVTPAQPVRLIATWQTGFESGGLVQRKLRLGFVNVPGQQRVN